MSQNQAQACEPSKSRGRRLVKHTSLEERHQQQHQQASPASGAQQDWAAMTLQMQKLQVSQPKFFFGLRFEGKRELDSTLTKSPHGYECCTTCHTHSCCDRSAASLQIGVTGIMSAQTSSWTHMLHALPNCTQITKVHSNYQTAQALTHSQTTNETAAAS